MIRLCIATCAWFSLASATASEQKWYEMAVKKVEARFTPAEARPGETVTFTLTVELHPGYHTYPLVQPDKEAAAMVNTIKLPDAGAIAFVGDTLDPKEFKTKAEPLLGIKELRYCTGTVVYSRKAIVSPEAAAGATTVKLKAFNLLVCDEDHCYSKTVPVQAAFKVLAAAAAPETRSPSPGVQGLAVASTDVAVVEVLETNPRRAIEGARDTVRLKVARTLHGPLASDAIIEVYYHLLWADEQGTVLEPLKFEKGKRYVVFLKSHVDNRGEEEGKRVVYELADQWLSVQPDHVGLVKETVVAVRDAHGDTAGEWSEPAGPLQARLVLVRSRVSNGTPIITAHLDVRNVAAGDNTVEFNLDRATATWTVMDDKGKAVAAVSPPGNGSPVPARKATTLVAGARERLVLSKSGAGIAKDQGGHLELASDKVWVFPRDGKAFTLQGKIEVKATGERGLWSGTLDLPPVKVPAGRE